MRWLLRVCGYLLPFCFAPAALVGQSVHGKLLDAETERPIAAATVALLSGDGQPAVGVLTDSSGAFVLQAPRTGRYLLRAERIGYQAVVSSPLDLFRGDTVAVELRLSTQAVVLAPLTVTVTPRPNLRNRALDGFYERQARGRGRFFTPADVERIRPVAATNLLQMTPGVNIRYLPGPGQRRLVLMRSGIRECIPTLFIDGHRAPLAPEIGIDDWVTGSDIRALEIYRSQLDAPAEFQSFNDCGVIVAWTEHGLGLTRYVQGQSFWRRLLKATGVSATLFALMWLVSGR